MSVAAALLAAVGCVLEAYAVVCERRMQKHRRPGVSYWAATLRRDGGWQRADLFEPQGLIEQRRAARAGMLGAACWVVALVLWVASPPS